MLSGPHEEMEDRCIDALGLSTLADMLAVHAIAPWWRRLFGLRLTRLESRELARAIDRTLARAGFDPADVEWDPADPGSPIRVLYKATACPECKAEAKALAETN